MRNLLLVATATAVLVGCKDHRAVDDSAAMDAYIARHSAVRGTPAEIGGKPQPPVAGGLDARSRSAPPPAGEVSAVLEPPTVGEAARRIQITVVDAAGLPDLDDGPGVTDAYVVLDYDGERYKTSVSSSQSPVWGDSFAFEVRADSTLRVTVMDEDTVSDEKLGVTTVALPAIRTAEQKMLDVPLGGGNNGNVRLKIVGL
jgi:hypothetical protein